MADVVEILITGKNLARPALDEVRGQSAGLASTMSKMGVVAGGALVAIGTEAVKMASSYQSSTTRLVTSAGESTKNIDLVRKGMLDMAGQVGVSAQDLSKAMYYVEAAGYHAGDGLKVLRAAAQGAAAEGASTTTVAQALTDVLVDYHMKASSAADVTSKMITAVSHGKVNLQDFAASFASIIPLASATGISFNDAASALAEMTNHGMTARRASQNLAQALRSLISPTSTMRKAFKEYGVSSDELKAKLHGPNGLTDAMQYLSQAALKAGKEDTPQFTAALKAMIGTAPGLLAALDTTGKNFTATSDTITAMGKASADAQGKVQGFALVQKTLHQQVNELKAGFDSLMIRLGNGLIPLLTKGTSGLLGMAGAAGHVLGQIEQGFTGSASKPQAAPHLAGAMGARMQAGSDVQLPAPKLTGWQQVGQVLKQVAADLRTFGSEAAKAFVQLGKAAGPTLTLLGTVALGALKTIAGILANVVGPALVQVTKFMNEHKTAVRDLIAVALVPLAVRLAALSVIKPVVAIAGLAKDVAMFPVRQSRAIFDGIKTGIGGVKKAAEGARAVWGGLRFGAVTAAQGIRDAFGKIPWARMGDGAGRLWDGVGRGALRAQLAITDFAGKARTVIEDGLLRAAGAAGTAWGTILRGARTARDAMVDFGSKAASSLASLGGKAVDGLVGGLKAVGSATKTAAVGLAEMAAKATMAAAAGLRVAAAWVAEKVALVASAVAEKAAAAAQWLLDAAMDANPIGLIVLAIAGLVVAFVELWKHSAAFRDFWKGLWKDVTKIISDVVDWVKKNWPLLLGILTGPIGIAVLLIVKNWRTISNGAQAVWRDVVHAFESMARWLAGLPGMIFHAVSGLFDFIGSEAASIYNTVVGWLQGIVNFAASIPSKIGGALSSLGGGILHSLGFAHGGVVGSAAVGGPRGGLTMVGEQGPELVSLPAGSTVHSNPDTQRMLAGAGAGAGSGQRPVINLTINMDGKKMAQQLIDPLRGHVRLLGGDVQIALGVNR